MPANFSASLTALCRPKNSEECWGYWPSFASVKSFFKSLKPTKHIRNSQRQIQLNEKSVKHYSKASNIYNLSVDHTYDHKELWKTFFNPLTNPSLASGTQSILCVSLPCAIRTDSVTEASDHRWEFIEGVPISETFLRARAMTQLADVFYTSHFI